MRKGIFLAFTVMIFGMAAASPAAATNAREAIRLCDKNPKCSYNVRDNGSVDLTVNGNHINCPQQGECTCDVCTHPSAIKQGNKLNAKIDAATVLQASRAAPKPKGANVPPGGLLDGRGGLTPQGGPSATGSPAMASPPPVQLR